MRKNTKVAHCQFLLILLFSSFTELHVKVKLKQTFVIMNYAKYC